MARTHYAIGRSAEYYVINKLKKLGATLVTRSAGSHGLADIIAFFPAMKEIWLIQVKTSKKGISVRHIEKEQGDLGARLSILEGDWTVRLKVFVRARGGWRPSLPV